MTRIFTAFIVVFITAVVLISILLILVKISSVVYTTTISKRSLTSYGYKTEKIGLSKNIDNKNNHVYNPSVTGGFVSYRSSRYGLGSLFSYIRQMHFDVGDSTTVITSKKDDTVLITHKSDNSNYWNEDARIIELPENMLLSIMTRNYRPASYKKSNDICYVMINTVTANITGIGMYVFPGEYGFGMKKNISPIIPVKSDSLYSYLLVDWSNPLIIYGVLKTENHSGDLNLILVRNDCLKKNLRKDIRGGTQFVYSRLRDIYISIGHTKNKIKGFENFVIVLSSTFELLYISEKSFIIDHQNIKFDLPHLIEFCSGLEILDDIATIYYGVDNDGSYKISVPLKLLISEEFI